ncbi:MAG: TonB-dependent receptor, partial [Rikenellaceae bacterium]
LPSSQIESMVIVKSPVAENPGDVAGGFIKITTKNLIDKNSLQIGVATGINTVTHSGVFKINRGGALDFLGFDAVKRPLASSFPSHLNLAQSDLTNITRLGFNNDWSVHKMAPAPDMRLSLSINRGFKTKKGVDVGLVGAIGYSSINKTMFDIKNSRYGAFASDVVRPEALEEYTDNQFVRENKINAMYNMSFKLDPKNRIDIGNIFNINGKNRLTERSGVTSNSGVYYIEQTEMLYTSRLSYAGQLAGNHIIDENKNSVLDWNVGYSYANKQEPDRRIVKNMVGYVSGQDINQLRTYNDKIQRYYQRLGDNVASLGANYKYTIGSGEFKPELKAGIFSTYRSRDYTPREFIYRYDNLTADARREYLYRPYEQMMSQEYLGADKVYIEEITQKSNAYTASDIQGAAYAAFNLPWRKFNAYIGARYEYSQMKLTYDKSMSSSKEIIITNKYTDGYLLPSVNLTYNLSDKHVVRFGYGKTINRPEFREVSPAVYQDFDLMGEVQGNENLKIAEIQNLDLRYEFYPSSGETISLGVFYKSFKNPIEWNFIDMGGTYRYSFDNAKSATNYGVELDIRKSLDFIGAKNLTFVANATYVKSTVKFNGSNINQERDRAMQGQSPYIINGGFYYDSPKLGLNASVLYNRIGKRIIGIGKSNSVNGSTDSDIPDSFEMPRNTIDLSIAKKLGKMFELKFAIKDLLSEDIVYQQFPTRVVNGVTEKISQQTKRCNAGSTYTFGLNINF